MVKRVKHAASIGKSIPAELSIFGSAGHSFTGIIRNKNQMNIEYLSGYNTDSELCDLHIRKLTRARLMDTLTGIENRRTIKLLGIITSNSINRRKRMNPHGR